MVTVVRSAVVRLAEAGVVVTEVVVIVAEVVADKADERIEDEEALVAKEAEERDGVGGGEDFVVGEAK